MAKRFGQLWSVVGVLFFLCVCLQVAAQNNGNISICLVPTLAH